MHRQSLTVKRIFLNAVPAMIAGLMLLMPVYSAQPSQDPSDRQRAFDLLEESKYIEALPLFEKLAITNPNDGQIIYWLGFCHIAKANDLKDSAARKAERKRGRDYLVRAKELGAGDEMSESLIHCVSRVGENHPSLRTTA